MRRYDPAGEGLDDAVARMAGETTEQQHAATNSKVTFHGVAAWQVTFAGGPPNTSYTEYWFDQQSVRYCVEVVGSQADVTALADAVQIA